MTPRKWCFRDLWVDHKTGMLRESAVWSNVGKAAMTFGFVLTVWRGGNSEWLWTAYGTIIVGHASVERLLGQRQQKVDKEVHDANPA